MEKTLEGDRKTGPMGAHAYDDRMRPTDSPSSALCDDDTTLVDQVGQLVSELKDKCVKQFAKGENFYAVVQELTSRQYQSEWWATTCLATSTTARLRRRRQTAA